MKKKGLILALFIILLACLSWFALNLKDNQGASDARAFNFKIEDTTTVSKIIITDAFGQQFTLIKKNNSWTDLKGGCVSKTNVSLILEAFHKIEFKGYLPQKSEKRFTELMASSHIKVEIFQDGEWTKTWYMGPASPDHYGQIMLLETANEGKSASPVMMKLAGMNGLIDPRFFADARQWACTEIMALQIEDIKSVKAKFYDEPYRSFELQKKGRRFQVTQNGQPLTSLDTTNVYRYLQGYQKIHFEQMNFSLSDKQVDSVKKSKPFCMLAVKTNNERISLSMFRIKSKEVQRNEFGELVNMDMNSFWCQLPDGALVRCQYFVFNPLILGHVFFPAMEAKFPENLRSINP
ncbi:MAG: hypothetical protein LW839_04660 [Cryomorphaceae bacterium]|jgi:hypothetical protein|nr:hypothetical protein [Cryomorphaceae bacterium]